MSEYQRGYYAGSKGAWPEHRPPVPPHPIMTQMMKAGMLMRDRADWFCATFDENDSTLDQLRSAIDDWDHAMQTVSGWVRAGAELSEKGKPQI